MAKTVDIQRKLKQQLDSLDELQGININIDSLLKSIKSEVNKFINANQKNINKLIDIEQGLTRVLNQKQSSMGTLEDNLKKIFTILSDIDRFSKKIISINKKIGKTSEILKSTNFDALKNFDMSVVTDFFVNLNRNFSAPKLNKLLKNINSISLDGLQIVTDDLQKFDLSIVNNFLGTINRMFGQDKLNKMIKKMTTTSNKEDFELVILYLKDMDVFLNESIKYLNKMTSRIKNYINKTNLTVGGAPGKVGQQGQQQINLGQLFWAGAAMSIISKEFPRLTKSITFLYAVMKGFKNSFTMIKSGFTTMVAPLPKGAGKMARVGAVMKGLVGVFGGLALAGGVVIAVFVMGLKKLLRGIEEAQRMRLEAARGAGLNELAFMGTSAAGEVTPGGILSRFAGASEERMIGSRAEYMSRMGGLESMGRLTSIQAKNMSVISELYGLTLEKTAQLRDIMENIMGLNFEKESINFINKYGVLANKVVKDISENTEQYVLYGSVAFEKMSILANKLAMNVKDAIKIVEKFSTVSSAIDTSFNLSLVTGKFVNPLTQFMQYAFGDTSDIFENVINQLGDITKMNRIQQKFLSETLGVSIDELTVASQRIEKIKTIGEDAYNKQYKTIDDIVKSFGFQRLLGGISEILDLIEKEVFRKYFQRALDWIKNEGTKIPDVIDKIVNFLDSMIPIIFRIFAEVGKALTTVLGFLPGTGITSAEATNINKSIDNALDFIVGGFGGSAVETGTRQKDSMDDGYITQGRIVKTNPRDSAVFATTPMGLITSAIQAASMLSGKQITDQPIAVENKSGEIKVLHIKSDVKLDGYKVGEGLTEIALEYGK